MAWFEHGTSRIYYEEEGSGDPLLLIPGITLSIQDLQAVRDALTPRYRVIAADPPGSGRSGPQPREYTAKYFHDDSRSFLALLDELKASPAHIVGFSDGCEYALVMAELQPEAVRSIVAWGSAGSVATPPEFLEAFGQVVDHPAPGLEPYSAYLKDTYGEENARATTQSAANAFKVMMESGGDISRKRAGEIACPALLITGEHDAMFAPPAVVSELAAAIPRAEFIEAKGAGHGVHHDSLEWLTKTVREWLARH
jgi:valacyclovir hydrolase